MKEVVLFNKEGKEIDWYDPVEEKPITKDDLLIIDNGFNKYEISLKNFHRYEWREKKEDD